MRNVANDNNGNNNRNNNDSNNQNPERRFPPDGGTPHGRKVSQRHRPKQTPVIQRAGREVFPK